MGALGEVGTRTEVVPNSGVKILQVVTPATAVSADTMTVDLSEYGCANIHGIIGFTTDGSEIVSEQPTTAVSSGVLTITIAGTAVTSARQYIIFAY